MSRNPIAELLVVQLYDPCEQAYIAVIGGRDGDIYEIFYTKRKELCYNEGKERYAEDICDEDH